MDIVDPLRRSRMMAGIGPRHTQPELVVRRLLHRLGFRFRLHRTGFPGRPDLVLPRYGVMIFVHGCFWHRHQGCSNCTMPKTRTNFWVSKFDQNMARDIRTTRALRRSGWRVITIWECQTEHPATIERRLLRILRPATRKRTRISKTTRARGSSRAWQKSHDLVT
jgi:DNA mismatch endonuclease (patch repair protein)